jgi:hypothetical protein
MAHKIFSIFFTFTFTVLFLQGCAANRKYAWGNYDSTLYRHYKNPQDKAKNLDKLKEILEVAEREDRVPPGLYAEYGYALYETGNISEAIINFEKEKAKWPESNILMEKMIRNAKRQEENLKKSSTVSTSGFKDVAK